MSLRSESIPMDLTSFNAQNLGDAIYQVIKKFGFDLDQDEESNSDALERLQEFSENIVKDIKSHERGGEGPSCKECGGYFEPCKESPFVCAGCFLGNMQDAFENQHIGEDEADEDEADEDEADEDE